MLPVDLYPPVAFHFAVRFGDGRGGFDAAFQEVSGIAAQMELDSLVEGGENRFVHQLPKAMKAQRLVLKRGVATLESELVRWCRSVFDGGLALKIQPRVVHVELRNAKGQPMRQWSMANAWPVQWDTQPFGAQKNEVAIEKIELAYAYAERFM
jgi:phage tail-like protein